MDKKGSLRIKLIVPAGRANPSPPIGPALGQRGINIQRFCKTFNEMTKNLEPGTMVPVKIEVYADKNFNITLKSTPTSILIKQNIDQADNTRSIDSSAIELIAKTKLADLNTRDLKKAASIIEGTAKSMGVRIRNLGSYAKTTS